MIQPLIITLREGIEAALVVGIIITYLAKTQKGHLKKYVWWGLISAIIASAGLAFLFTRITINQEALEGAIMWVAASLIISMVVWMWKTARKIREDIEEKVERYSITGQILGLFFFTFLMVLREGAETVLFLGALSLGDNPVLSLFGGLVGILLAVGFAVFFIKGSLRINLNKFFLITSLVLFIIVAQLLIGGYHELAEVGIIPASPGTMGIVGPIVRNEALFIMAIIAIPLLVMLVDVWREKPSLPEGLTGAERRKLLGKFKRERRWKSVAFSICLAVLFIIGASYFGSELPAKMPVKEVKLQKGKIEISAEKIPVGYMKKFKIKDTRFFVYRLNENSFAVNLDACMICGSYGYYQRGEEVICRNCEAPINAGSLNIGGGCNPIPVDFSLEEGKIKIQMKDLGLQDAF